MRWYDEKEKERYVLTKVELVALLQFVGDKKDYSRPRVVMLSDIDGRPVAVATDGHTALLLGPPGEEARWWEGCNFASFDTKRGVPAETIEAASRACPRACSEVSFDTEDGKAVAAYAGTVAKVAWRDSGLPTLARLKGLLAGFADSPEQHGVLQAPYFARLAKVSSAVGKTRKGSWIAFSLSSSGLAAALRGPIATALVLVMGGNVHGDCPEETLFGRRCDDCGELLGLFHARAAHVCAEQDT